MENNNYAANDKEAKGAILANTILDCMITNHMPLDYLAYAVNIVEGVFRTEALILTSDMLEKAFSEDKPIVFREEEIDEEAVKESEEKEDE